jgi:hypothetical protein
VAQTGSQAAVYAKGLIEQAGNGSDKIAMKALKKIIINKI